MKRKLQALRQRFFGGDILNRTQKRLTFYNSGLLMVLLILFAIIVYLLLYSVMAIQEKQNLQNLINQTLVYQGEVQSKHGNQQDDPLMAVNEDLFFYAIVDSSGNELAGNARMRPLQRSISASIRGWIPKEGETKSAQFTVPHPSGMGGMHRHKEQMKDHQVHLLLSGQPIYQGGRHVGVVYVGIDQTAHKRLFEVLLWILANVVLSFYLVAFWVSHMMAKKAMGPVQESFLRQREFVADASHELRTPLSVLHTSLEVLELEEEEKLTDYSRQVIDDMKDEVKRMTNLVGDLLTLARMDSGKADVILTQLDIGPFAEQIVRSIQPVAAQKGIQVNAQLLPSLQVVGDAEKLKQLFYILLENAIKYTPENGKITIVLETRDKRWQLRVKDSGIGIQPEDKQKIFERFFRVEKHRSRQMGGTGLGLSIARWIVSAHKGEILVKSKYGKGSEFIVTIPLSLKEATTG
ncbi:sensor histidine kinase [Neobacillus notoginsengisoli]|uniref:histidine kinase n=1 Tax=Neobacillus notoginsengisoli TaxID=1578198 RepID=A0A417YW26_9BACI|nr:ATP-binding protein [Neobacillus notoginsengisoli]RHW41623.1 sensor histidine kinase [Neobacillus notoginsengisoli]